MTVRELMTQLSAHDPDMPVWIKETGDEDIFIKADGVGVAELGRHDHAVTVEFRHPIKMHK